MKIQEIFEEVTPRELYRVDQFANDLWNKLGIDVKFSTHFLQRVNDARNQPPVYVDDLVDMFRKGYRQYGKDIGELPDQAQGILKDLFTKLNMPFVMSREYGGNTLIAKSTMRKSYYAPFDGDIEFKMR